MQRTEELKICLVGVPIELTESELKHHLEKQIPASKFFLELQSKKNGKNFGWGTLTLDSVETYQAILNNRRFIIKGKNVFAKKFMDPDSLQKFKKKFNKRRLFLKGIPLSMGNEELRSVFGVFGNVEDAYVVKNLRRKKSKKKADSRTNSKTSYGFVVFESEEDARVVKNMGSLNSGGFEIQIQGFRSKEVQKEDVVISKKDPVRQGKRKYSKFAKKNRKAKTRDAARGYESNQTNLVSTNPVTPVAQHTLERAQQQPRQAAYRTKENSTAFKIIRKSNLLAHWGNNLRINPIGIGNMR